LDYGLWILRTSGFYQYSGYTNEFGSLGHRLRLAMHCSVFLPNFIAGPMVLALLGSGAFLEIVGR